MTTLNVIQLTSQDLQDLVSEAVRKELSLLKDQLKQPRQEEYLTREDLMQLLNISKGTLNNWVKAGRLLKHGVGGRVYFKRSEVEQAMVELK